MIFSGSKVKIYYVDKDRITERKKMFTSSELIYGWKQCTSFASPHPWAT